MGWQFWRKTTAISPTIDVLNVRDRPVGDEHLKIAQTADPAPNRDTFIHVGTLNAPEAVTFFSYEETHAGAEKWFHPSQTLGRPSATLVGVASYDGLPLHVPPPPQAPAGLPCPVPQLDAVSLPAVKTRVRPMVDDHALREFKFMQRVGYRPQRIAFSEDLNRIVMVQQLFGSNLFDMILSFDEVPSPAGKSVPGRALMWHLGKSIARMHRAGVIHCDVNLQNSALLPETLRKLSSKKRWQDDFSEEQVGLIDLGNAMDAKGATLARLANRGTAPYEALEQVLPEKNIIVTTAVDIWALGANILAVVAKAPDIHPFDREVRGLVDAAAYRASYQHYIEWRAKPAYQQEVFERVFVALDDGDAFLYAMDAVLNHGLPVKTLREIAAGPADSYHALPMAFDVPGLGLDASLADCLCDAVRACRTQGLHDDHLAFSCLFAKLKVTDPALHDVVRKCMHPKPTQRPKIEKILEALGTADGQKTPGAKSLPGLALTHEEHRAFDLVLDSQTEFSDPVDERLQQVSRLAPHCPEPGMQRARTK